jgi:hypothetical protein
MRREFLVAGIVLGIIGVLVFFLGIVKVPYTTTEWVDVPKSGVLMDETIVIPALTYHYLSKLYVYDEILHISFTVTEGGNKDIDFWVMEEKEFTRFEADETFYYYTTPSRARA